MIMPIVFPGKSANGTEETDVSLSAFATGIPLLVTLRHQVKPRWKGLMCIRNTQLRVGCAWRRSPRGSEGIHSWLKGPAGFKWVRD